MDANAAYVEAQRAVIGSVLIDPDKVLGIAMDKLRPEQFRDQWRTIFDAIRALWLDQKPVDPVTVLDRCGPVYEGPIRRAMAATPTAANIAAYCDAVRDQAALLRLQELGAALVASPTAEDARRILAEGQAAALERPGIRAYTVTELLQAFFLRVTDDTPPKYLPWGIKGLDEGLTAEPGDLIILGADSSVGKTALAVQLAWTMAARGYRVGFFSLETSAAKLTDRIVAQRARLSMDSIKRHRITPEETQEVLAIGNASMGIHLDVIPCSGVTVADVRALTVARQYQVIFIDYVQLLQAEGRERWEVVTNISMQLHTLAQSLGVAVIGLSQITAETKGAKRPPSKDDLRESRQLKQDADLILMMSLQNPDDASGPRWLRTVKNKDGPLVNLCLKFDPQHMDFTPTDSRALDRWAREKQKAKFTDLPDDFGQEVMPF